MRSPPQHVPADLDPRERHGPVGVGRVDDIELETVGRQIFEGSLEIEGLERTVRVLARPYFRSNALPVSEQRPLDLRDACFHAAFLRFVAGGLRRSSANSCRHHYKEQQRYSDARAHAHAFIFVWSRDTVCLPGRSRAELPCLL